MPIKMYKMDLSPPARAAMMVVDFVKVPIEMIELDLFKDEHMDPSFIKKNPIHTVPFIEDGDFSLADSHAIAAYLIDSYGTDEQLYPKDPKKRALVDQMLYFDATFLFGRLKNVSLYVFRKGDKNPAQEKLALIAEAYDFIETYLTRNKYIAGDNMTIADICAVATVSSFRHFVPISIERNPKVQAWFSEMQKKPFYKKYSAPGDILYENLVKEKLSS